jgi:hypothetical protein
MTRPKIFAALAVAAIAGLASQAAQATPVVYDFTATATDGPLAGNTASGTFTFDSSLAVPDSIHDATDLLSALDFTWDGITYDASTANTGYLAFDDSGNVTAFAIGNNCQAGSCTAADGTEEWFAFLSLSNGFSYTTPSGGGGGGVSFTQEGPPPVPEPMTLSLFGAGIAGAAALRRKRERKQG